MAYSTFTLTGTFKTTTGVAESVTVTVIPSVPLLVDGATGGSILAGVVAQTFSTGVVSIANLPTTGGDILPASGWGYTVLVNTASGQQQTRTITTPPAAGSSLDIKTLTSTPVPVALTDTAVGTAALDSLIAAKVGDVASLARAAVNKAVGRYFTPEAYGAVGDGVADDTQAVRDCFTAANALARTGHVATIKHPGATVVLTGTYKLTSLAASIDVLCNVTSNRATFAIPDAYAGVAVRVGHATSGSYLQAADVHLPDIVKTTVDVAIAAGSIGCRLQNVGDSVIRFGRVTHFETGINCSGDGQGTAYNTINLGWISYCKKSLTLKPHTATGWANQNTFIGGSMQQSPNYDAGDGTGTGIRRTGWRHVVLDGSAGQYVNGNTFVGTSFEGDVSEYWAEFKTAASNQFIGTRHEQGTAGVAVTVSGDTLTKTGHGLAVGDMVTFAATSAPTGMITSAPYWVVTVPTADTFKVSFKKSGTAITFSSAGTGVTYYRPPRVRFDLSGTILGDNTIQEAMTQHGIMEVSNSAAGGTNNIHQRPGWIARDTYDPEDIPLFRARNSSGAAGLTRAVFAAYPAATNPFESPMGWTAALSDLGVMFAASDAEVGRLNATSSGVLKWKRPADSAAVDVPTAVRNQAGALSISGLSCAANTTTTTTVTLTGASVNDHVKVTMLSHVAGIVFSHAYVSSANTLTLVFGNLTASPISLTTTVEAMAIRRYF